MPKRTRKNKKYSAEIKLQAVESYLNGEGGLWAVCRKYGILNEKQLRNWIKWYNGHKEFKERSAAKGEIYMTKGRKTTQEERAANRSILHRTQQGLRTNSRNLQRVVPTDLCLGAQV